jgi:hypothetical protein
MNIKLIRIWMEIILPPFEALYPNLAGGTEEK